MRRKVASQETDYEQRHYL